MKENTKEKSLLPINENSVFFKIKNFFRKLFYKERYEEEQIKKDTINIPSRVKSRREVFVEEIEEKPQIDVFQLKQMLRSGFIQVKDLSKEEQIKLILFYEFEIEAKKSKLERLEKELIQKQEQAKKKTENV